MILSAYLPLSICATATTPSQDKSLGEIEWSQESPPKSGIDAAASESLYSEMAQEPHHDLKGIVIVRNGPLVSEHYFNVDSVDALHDIRSATKSITSLLMGITIKKGLVQSVNDSIALYLAGFA
jgi:CubicO group peptidase (beta-lactamase class C family)